MNRFRTKKKGRDEDGVPRPSQDSGSSKPFRAFRKGKKSEENEEKPIDLATVLPSNDDFRTSLLMTGLSARFSMLREQDDPNTKIGKASDDSVLYPKRQSRMDMSSFRGLGDIAEVESIKAASPFTRMGSFHSDDADSLNSGSIMSRAKPTEGNNLFGGRQKIYKIPASASSSRTVDGGMAGRALYDDDVAQSAFQRWRRAEKERELMQNEGDGSDTPDDQRNSSADLNPSRSESPAFSSYDKKRETSSTLSSIPSIARNSSTATSITSSQPAPSLKDWQPPNTSSSGSGPERSVTRTRRLYETGFSNKDSQESGTGGLSRMDTLNRQRLFGTRTPDSSYQPLSLGFTDRLSGERRLLAKGSAPNLRSISPPSSASPTGTPNLGIRIPSVGEGEPNFGGAPPLSPPISETGENAILPINPNDRGKATALGVFQKPTQPYDESRYAQRQLQLQRGRETPTQRTRDEQNPPAPKNQPRSPSPARQEAPDSPTVPVSSGTQFLLREEAQPTSFLADPDTSETSSMVSPKPLPSPQIHLRRPSDREHPAFRDSALPTPLSLDSKPQDELSPMATDSQGLSPADSPTLGPGAGSSGLSGMVRQHLRADSNASSIYDVAPSTAGLEPRFNTTSKVLEKYGTASNPWEVEDNGRDWNLDLDVNEPLTDAQSFVQDNRPTEAKMVPLSPSNGNKDEFASQLADGARRIRERLTSYVETDSRSSSPQRVGEQNDAVDLPPLPRPSGLGAILRPRSSRGSIIDRGRDPSSTKAFKMMGISPGGSRTASPASESQRGQVETDGESGHETQDKETAQDGDDRHPGLRQFRQARRELQRLKEVESQSRHYPAPQGPPPDIPSPQPRMANGPRTRAPSRDQKPGPIYYQQRMPSEESWNGDFPPTSQAQSRNDRQRSESESSQGARTNGGAVPSGDGFLGRENSYLGPAGPASRPAMRSPGLPGTDIKRSHFMPPHPHPNTLRANQSALDSTGKLYVPRGHESGQPSPTSPGASPLVNSAPQTPLTLSPPRPPVTQTRSYDSSNSPVSGYQEAMRRKVDPRDISEPTLVMSTSRVPTVALPPEAESNRSRSNSRAAPPVPPINPRRRQDGTKVRTVLESFARQGRDRTDNEDDSNTRFRRGQRAMADMPNMNQNFNKPWGSSPTANAGPPASRIVSTQGRKASGNTGLPGGMI
ncbi:hypothetical protein O1611_g4306 [Lasiodiplodia mahajangana]|uniref:Uncharacterized protein n=1 Tax=Lasiodiplodia mahajangana TaxID=1108764 RepID=A0ACC2JPC5_9PEZI|nr:hypothetical protein O1611_g4306 [Lasiodiplodia mahajangana]